jgi:hypothetical protein
MKNEKLYKEFKEVIEANPELKEYLKKPGLLVLKVKSGEFQGTYIGPAARGMQKEIRDINNNRIDSDKIKWEMTGVHLDEYWSRELIGMYL